MGIARAAPEVTLRRARHRARQSAAIAIALTLATVGSARALDARADDTATSIGGRGADVGAGSVGPGRAPIRLGGALAGWHVFRLDPDTPRERPSGRLDLRIDAEHGERLHFFGAIRAGYDGKIGDAERGNPLLVLDEVYQDKDVFVELDEAYLDLYLETFELRVGKQKISWGQLDDLQPSDHLNPEDLTEFFFRPELERKIGIPAVRLTGYRGPWIADLVWAPVYTAYRLPNRDDRWFPPLLQVPDRVDTPLGSVPVRTRYPDVDPPPYTLASSDVGLRVTRFLGGAELAGTVFHGWDKSPGFHALGTATVTPTGNPEMPAAPSVDFRIMPSLHRITVVGADVAVPVWLLALRAEAAWIHGRFFPLLIRDQVGHDPRLVEAVAESIARVARSGRAETIGIPLPATELERESLQLGVGVDYFVSEAVSRRLVGDAWLARAFVLLQLIETVIFDHDAPFISDRVEHLLALTLRHTFRDERVLTELKIAYNPNHGDYFVWPQLAYKLTPSLHALFEARIIGGSPNHQIGQYRDHDGIRVGFRYLF